MKKSTKKTPWTAERQRHAVLSACLIRGRLSYLDTQWREGRIEVAALRCAKNETGRTPLFISCQNGYLDTVKWLYTNGCSDQVKSDTKEKGVSPIYIACYQGHLKVARWLFSHGARIDLFRPDPSTGFLPIHAACLGGHRDVVLWIRDVFHEKKNKDRVFTIPTSRGVMPMDICAILGHEDLAKAIRIYGGLVEASAIPRLKGYSYEQNRDSAIAAKNIASMGMSMSLWQAPNG